MNSSRLAAMEGAADEFGLDFETERVLPQGGAAKKVRRGLRPPLAGELVVHILNSTLPGTPSAA